MMSTTSNMFCFLVICLLALEGCGISPNRRGSSSVTPRTNLPSHSTPVTSRSDVEWKNAPNINCVSYPTSNEIWVTSARDGTVYKGIIDKDEWGLIDNYKAWCIAFISDTTGWRIGEDDSISKTVDGGRNWVELPQDLGLSAVRRIEFVDTEKGWLLDAFSLYSSADGGKSWRRELQFGDNNLPGSPFDYVIKGGGKMFVCMESDDSGWVLRKDPSGKNHVSRIFHNTGSGKYAKTGPFGCGLSFIDEKAGWVILGEDSIYKTSDGGINWIEVKTMPSGFVPKSTFWTDTKTGWLTGFSVGTEDKQPMNGIGTLLKTSDGGLTWRRIKVSESDNFFDKIYFRDQLNGYLTSRNGLFLTSDGGTSWNKVFSLD